MNWDEVKGQWKQLRGKARTTWGDLTDNDWEQIAGRRDQLIGKIQERYGRNKSDAEREADSWLNNL